MHHFIGRFVFLIAFASLSHSQIDPKEYVGDACMEDEVLGQCQFQCHDIATRVEEASYEDGAGLIDNRKSSDDDEPIACPDTLTCCVIVKPAVNPSVTTTNTTSASGKEKPCGWTVGPPGTGGLANPGETPWMASIMLQQGGENGAPSYAFLGNGALIHSRVVLTTIHSLRNHDAMALFVLLGDHDQLDTGGKKQVIPVDEAVSHPGYNISIGQDDYGLLFLSYSTNLTAVAPVCLPPQGHVVPAGTSCFFTGWGPDCTGKHQTVLTKTVVPVVDRARCQTLQRKTKFGEDYELLPSFMCAGGEIGKDICKGAGGSPLVCPIRGQSGRYMVNGLVEFAATDGTDGTPTLFADVGRVRDWIDKAMTERELETSYGTY